jgi:hypothetical protein
MRSLVGATGPCSLVVLRDVDLFVFPVFTLVLAAAVLPAAVPATGVLAFAVFAGEELDPLECEVAGDELDEAAELTFFVAAAANPCVRGTA